MGGSFTIGRVRGIAIRIHFSFLLILPILALIFSEVFVDFRLAATLAGLPSELVRGSPLFWGIMLAIALFASVLVHELAHAVMAMRKGGKVKDITLLMIGGVSNVTEMPKNPKDEAVMALVGPVTSIALAAVLYGLFLLLGETALISLRFAVFYLAALNLVLGLFNLLPAFPMDGGRILRGLLATRMGPVRATEWAARLGKVFSIVFVIWAFFTLNFFLLIIAFFVYIGAEAEAGQVVAQSVLGAVRVADLVKPPPSAIDPTLTVAHAAARMLQEKQTALLVMRGDELVGEVVLDDVSRVPPERRSDILVSGIIRPAPAVSPDTNLWDALRMMTEKNLPLLPVTEGGRLVGVIGHEDVVRSLRLYQLERRAGAPTPGLQPRERPA